MSHTLQTELIPKLQTRYTRRDRAGKMRLIDELCEDNGYERKYASRLLRAAAPAPSGRPYPGPAPRYTLIEPVARAIWLAAEQPCGKRLAPALPLWLPHYETRHGKFSRRARELLLAVSPATLDRLLAGARATEPLRGRCGTKPGTLLKTAIPIRTDSWEVTRPGYLEAISERTVRGWPRCQTSVRPCTHPSPATSGVRLEDRRPDVTSHTVAPVSCHCSAWSELPPASAPSTIFWPRHPGNPCPPPPAADTSPVAVGNDAGWAPTVRLRSGWPGPPRRQAAGFHLPLPLAVVDHPLTCLAAVTNVLSLFGGSARKHPSHFLRHLNCNGWGSLRLPRAFTAQACGQGNG